MLKHGVTTCVDFFYLQDDGNDNAEAVIAGGARQVGIRLVLARTMYDWDGAPTRYRETPADAARRVRELIGAHRRRRRPSRSSRRRTARTAPRRP